MKEILTVKANLDRLLSITGGGKIREWSDSDMTQQRDFGPSWPEVAGFGEGTPQQAISEVFPARKTSEIRKCINLHCLRISNLHVSPL